MSRIALDGAPPLVPDLPAWPIHGIEEEHNLIAALRSGHWWGLGGSFVARFEASFAASLSVDRVIGVTNGTHALELALRAEGIGLGDEVVVPALTFVATSMAVMSVGAVPIPVDVHPETWCLDPEATERAIGSRTRAVIPVHLAGLAADLDRLVPLARDHDLVLIEDAAHGHGGTHQGRPLGSVGDYGAFSFQNFKLMTCGEGGALAVADPVRAGRARCVANCGRDPEDAGYDHAVLGSNFRLSELHAAVLCAQLDRLESQATARAHALRGLRRRLDGIPGVRAQVAAPSGSRHAGYMVVFTVEDVDRDWVVRALAAEGLPARRMYPRVHDTRHFTEALARLDASAHELPASPASEWIARQGVWLHHRLLLGEDGLLDRVGLAVERVVQAARGRPRRVA